MSKLLILLAVYLAHATLTASSPFIGYGGSLATVAYHQPALATVGAVVRTIPTSVSHASHAVVHKSGQVVQDVVTPVVKTTYTAPIGYATYASAPVSYTSYAAASPYAYGV